jgi:hypothetical protein
LRFSPASIFLFLKKRDLEFFKIHRKKEKKISNLFLSDSKELELSLKKGIFQWALFKVLFLKLHKKNL